MLKKYKLKNLKSTIGLWVKLNRRLKKMHEEYE